MQADDFFYPKTKDPLRPSEGLCGLHTAPPLRIYRQVAVRTTGFGAETKTTWNIYPTLRYNLFAGN